MTVELRPITRANLAAVLRLAPAPEQRGFVATNSASIAEAHIEPGWTPLAIVAGDTPVGFAMYGQDDADGSWWLIRYMIAAAAQGQGYGSAALSILLERMRAAGAGAIRLGVMPENGRAIRLYQRFGFAETGEIEDGETIMRRPAPPRPDSAVTLDRVTAENIDAVLRLTFKPEQTGFVAVNAKSIAQAYVHRRWIPLVVSASGAPVGFAQYVVGDVDGRSWILRLMIDGASQGKGYGRAALALLLERMTAEGAGEIHLSSDPRNAAALHLYRSFGFAPTGEAIEKWDEIILARPPG
jgi:diamine N-acetyltransferase